MSEHISYDETANNTDCRCVCVQLFSLSSVLFKYFEWPFISVFSRHWALSRNIQLTINTEMKESALNGDEFTCKKELRLLDL